MRFTIRRLLLTITAACVTLGFVVSRAHSQRDAVQKIEELGGTVYFRDDISVFGNWMFASSSTSSIAKHLRHSATGVKITFHEYDDTMEQQLRRLSHLNHIELYGHDAAFGVGKIEYDFPSIDVDRGYWVGF
ncbi:hypothetical protein [Mariniblastus fucicola]|uniref:Uncharacterized protein n=1 Tax=Mariniblastus fucicola TaxID=980251 RepID=A0A5B9PAK6_9BACT|nr:hypothetical protein [Mariniblastus fucicola]QEG21992.1 hypothetical protein MFFC18_18530 [Mariniblastus fucicola]